MKNTYRIYPIMTCKLILDQGWFTYRVNYGNKIPIPVYTWLIEGDGKPFLIDTGCTYEDINKLPNKVSTGGEEGTPIEDSLQKLGVSVSDIETIILTHIHHDHILGAKKFPRAKFIVQEEELIFANNPHPLFAGLYNKDFHGSLNYETINGDTEIMPGIEAIFTPGHTPGGQSISVNTEKGKMVIVGYCSIDENFGEKGDMVVGLHNDLYNAYNSMVKLRQIAGTLIPLHSNRLINVKSIP